MTERNPDMAEVHQTEAEYAEDLREVPVRVEGPVDVRSLPAVAWSAQRFEVTDTTGPIRATGRNPFRKRILLHSETAGFFYGAAQAQVQGRGNCPFIVNGVVVELTHTEEIWINNVAAASPVVSVVEEMWTS
jgi:hypothetical protein